MDIYYVVMIMLLIGSIWLSSRKSEFNSGYFLSKTIKNGKLRVAILFINIAIYTLFIIMSMRALSVGSDTRQYEVIFQMANEFDLTDWNSYIELGFLFLNKIIYSFTRNFRVALVIYSILSLIGPAYIVRKYSLNPFYSLFLFLTMGFLASDLSGIRTAIALSILCFAFDFALKREFWKYLIVIIAATLFHRTALAFLLVYPLMRRKMTLAHVAFHIVGTILVYMLRRPIMNFVVGISYFNKYAQFVMNTQASGYAFVILAVFLIMYFCGQKYRNEEEEHSDAYYNMILIAFTFQVLASINTNMMRLTNLFYFYAVILIPNVMKRMNSRSSKALLCIFFTVLMMIQYMYKYHRAYGVGDYMFYWQQGV